MCLVTEQKRVKILKEDLIVYKVVYPSVNDLDHVKAIHMGFRYTIGKLYEQKLRIDNIPDSYADAVVGDHYKFWGDFHNIASKMTNVHNGFHFYCSINRAQKSLLYRTILVKCTVPKGSRVYFDATGLGAANQIIINEVK